MQKVARNEKKFLEIQKVAKTVPSNLWTALVENTTRTLSILTKFEVFGNVMKHCLEISSQSKLRSTRINKILKVY